MSNPNDSVFGKSASQQPAPPAPEPAGKRGFLSSMRGKVLLAVVVVVLVAAGAGAAFVLPRVTSQPVDIRHGLPGAIPLPANTTFVKQLTTDITVPVADASVPKAPSWYFTVGKTTVEAMSGFYQGRLGGPNWRLAGHGERSENFVMTAAYVDALNGPANSADFQEWVITITTDPLDNVAAPVGGVALRISSIPKP